MLSIPINVFPKGSLVAPQQASQPASRSADPEWMVGPTHDDEERRHSVVDGPASQKDAHFEALFHVLCIGTPPEEAEFAESSVERVQE